MKRATVLLVMLVLGLVTACSPAAPTPTPEPTPTPADVLATKPEHLAGIWLDGEAQQYQRWDADGTIWGARNLEDLRENPEFVGRFWFEDGLYHEDEGLWCDGIGVYRVYLRIRGGRADRLYTKVVKDPCLDRRIAYARPVSRVD